MSEYSISREAPLSWQAGDDYRHALFHTSAWQELLESSFRCRTLYLAERAQGSGGAVSVFTVGPFSIGYFGFPFGGVMGTNSSELRHIVAQLASARDGLPLCIRIPVSAFGDPVALDLPFAVTPETAIVSLPAWSLSTVSSNIRRDLKKAGRHGLSVEDASDPRKGAAIFAMYRATIERFKGSLRYTERYFDNLIRLAQNHPNLRVLTAVADGRIAAFNVVARHGDSAFYLHGGTDFAMRELRPAAILMHTAINWGRDLGCTRFNLMSSPAHQHSLIQYKEKWGGETRAHRTYTLALRPTYRVFAALEKIAKRVL